MGQRVLSALSAGFLVTGALGIVGLMALTVVGVFWRYVLGDPIFGINDVSMMTLVVVAASAVAYGATSQAHVSVNLITMIAGRAVTRWTDLVMRILAVFITTLAAYALAAKACGFARACITSNLSIEHAPFYHVLALAMGFYALTFTVHLITGLAHFTGDDPNEPPD